MDARLQMVTVVVMTEVYEMVGVMGFQMIAVMLLYEMVVGVMVFQMVAVMHSRLEKIGVEYSTVD